MKGVIDRGILKSLLGSKQFEEIVRKKEDISRNKVLATSTSTEMFGKKVHIPLPSLFPKRRSPLLPKEQAHKMAFYHKTTKARESFKMTLTYLKKNPKPR